jgi:crossover junction endodeoxyribonuclease RuvC
LKGAQSFALEPWRIIGLDPGANCVGFAIIEAQRANPFHPRDFKILDAGSLRTPRQASHADKIGLIHDAVFLIAEKWAPNRGVIERAFFGVNHHSALRLGEARGSLIAALRRLKIPVHEIAPAAVKKVIAGDGRATKEAVNLSLKMQLGFELGRLPHDVSDAVAIAVGHCMLGTSASKLDLRSPKKMSKTWEQLIARREL